MEACGACWDQNPFIVFPQALQQSLHPSSRCFVTGEALGLAAIKWSAVFHSAGPFSDTAIRRKSLTSRCLWSHGSNCLGDPVAEDARHVRSAENEVIMISRRIARRVWEWRRLRKHICVLIMCPRQGEEMLGKQLCVISVVSVVLFGVTGWDTHEDTGREMKTSFEIRVGTKTLGCVTLGFPF